MELPANPYEARTVAREYVRKMVSRGYTSADAAREVCSGFGGPGEAGYDLKSGRITVPSYGSSRWTFSFAELESEVLRGGASEQLTLFEMLADGGAAK